MELLVYNKPNQIKLEYRSIHIINVDEIINRNLGLHIQPKSGVGYNNNSEVRLANQFKPLGTFPNKSTPKLLEK